MVLIIIIQSNHSYQCCSKLSSKVIIHINGVQHYHPKISFISTVCWKWSSKVSIHINGVRKWSSKVIIHINGAWKLSFTSTALGNYHPKLSLISIVLKNNHPKLSFTSMVLENHHLYPWWSKSSSTSMVLRNLSSSSINLSSKFIIHSNGAQAVYQESSLCCLEPWSSSSQEKSPADASSLVMILRVPEHRIPFLPSFASAGRSECAKWGFLRRRTPRSTGRKAISLSWACRSRRFSPKWTICRLSAWWRRRTRRLGNGSSIGKICCCWSSCSPPFLCADEFCGRWKTGFLVEKMFVGRAENTDFVNNISSEERNVGWKM